MKEIKITEIGIKIGDKNIKLSPEETRELYLKLKELFPDPVYHPVYMPPIVTQPVVIPTPYTYPLGPMC